MSKAIGLSSLALVHTLSGVLPLYVVTEFPRSGGTWVGQLLAGYLRLPFHRNRFPHPCSAVVHVHYLYSPTIRNACVVFRDGRDAMISFYYHCLFRNDLFNNHFVEVTRRQLRFRDYEDIDANLPRFIEHVFERNRYPRFTWAEFVRSWSATKAVKVCYEELLADTPGSLARLLHELTGSTPDPARVREVCEEYSFQRQTGRSQGQENIHRFLRKGVAGDWRRHYGKEARQVFNRYAGRELRLLGYEGDDSWV